jgi:HD superfamily phosphodiesterase
MAEIIDLVAILEAKREAKRREEQEELEQLGKIVSAWMEAIGENEPTPYYVPIEEQISQIFLTGEE